MEESTAIDGCSLCSNWNNGKGNKDCLKCKPINQAANHGNYYHRGFVTDGELIQDVTDSQKLKDIFSCLSHIEPEPRAIFEDYTFSDISMNTIARQRGISRQRVHQIICEVRVQCKKMLNLSTVLD